MPNVGITIRKEEARFAARNELFAMIDNLLELAYRLTQAGEPFVVATVVWCERPTSAKPGAQAIVREDGTMTGWLGGSCAQPVLLRRRLRILPDAHTPCRPDVGAVTAEEIAATILAELVQVRRRGPVVNEGDARPAVVEQSENSGDTVPGTAVDPVCGMIVEVATARHRSTLDGQDFYFCCAGCKRLFERNPQEYLVQNER